MNYAVLLGGAVVTGWSIFLSIRGMVRLYKENERKLLACTVVVFVLLPALAGAGLRFWYDNLNIWKSLMILLLGISWICLGFFVDAYLKQEKKRKLEGREKIIPKAPKHLVRNQCLLIAASLAVWGVGAFAGYGNATVETCLLCASLYFLLRAVGRLWRYRGF